MNAIVLKKSQLQAIVAEQKETSRGKQEFREFYIDGVYGNFWGPVIEKSYEFVYIPRDANDPTKGGALKHQSRRKLTEISKDEVKIVEAKPLPTSSLLAMLTKKAVTKVTADDDDE